MPSTPPSSLELLVPDSPGKRKRGEESDEEPDSTRALVKVLSVEKALKFSRGF